MKREALLERGWTEEEIEKSEKILMQAPVFREMQVVVYWFVVVLLSLLVVFLSVWLIPFFMFLENWPVYFITALFGLIFGASLNNAITHLEHLENHHFVLAGIMIPLVAVISLSLVMDTALLLDEILNLEIQHNPLLVAGSFIIAFLLPYLYGAFYHKARKTSKKPL